MELSDLADEITWYLSDWMDEASISSIMKKLLDPDLLNTWLALKDMAKTQKAFEDLFCMAADSIYRYEHITENKYREELLTLAHSLKKIKESLPKKNLENICLYLDHRLNGHIRTEAQKANVTFHQKPLPRGVTKKDFLIKTVNILGELVAATDNLLGMTGTVDFRLSQKKGRSGLVAFYTNELCEVTKTDFKRPCYAEIASIANVTLEIDEEKVITSESVRMNYNNYLERTRILEPKD